MDCSFVHAKQQGIFLELPQTTEICSLRNISLFLKVTKIFKEHDC